MNRTPHWLWVIEFVSHWEVLSHCLIWFWLNLSSITFAFKQIVIPPCHLQLCLIYICVLCFWFFAFGATAALRYLWQKLRPTFFASKRIMAINNQALVLVHNSFSQISLQEVAIVLRMTVFIEHYHRSQGQTPTEDAIQRDVAAADAVLAIWERNYACLVLVQLWSTGKLLREATATCSSGRRLWWWFGNLVSVKHSVLIQL